MCICKYNLPRLYNIIYMCVFKADNLILRTNSVLLPGEDYFSHSQNSLVACVPFGPHLAGSVGLSSIRSLRNTVERTDSNEQGKISFHGKFPKLTTFFQFSEFLVPPIRVKQLGTRHFS